MTFSHLDRYSRYLVPAVILIALVTYWRFRDVELSSTYRYVAQQDVVHSVLLSDISSSRSIVWDFFGLVDRLVAPRSVDVVRIAGLLLMLLNCLMLPRMLDLVLGQRIWGLLTMFLVALSPPAIVAAVSGGPAAVALTLVILYLLALYRSEYVFAGIIAGVGFAASLPGFMMFLVAVLDLLQNFEDRDKLLKKLLASSGAFVAVAAAIAAFSYVTGRVAFLPVPLGDRDLKWTLDGAVPLIALNALNIVGAVYLVLNRRFDVYRNHFHTLALWITFGSLCVVQPNTLNILSATALSGMLAAFFMQGFSSMWRARTMSAGTFVFLLLIVFLAGDMFGNNRFVANRVIPDCRQKSGAVDRVVQVVGGMNSAGRLVSNFASSELAVRLGRPVYEVRGDFLPIENFPPGVSGTTYVASSTEKADTLLTGCRLVFTTKYLESGKEHFVQIIDCGNTR